MLLVVVWGMDEIKSPAVISSILITFGSYAKSHEPPYNPLMFETFKLIVICLPTVASPVTV